MSRRLAAALYLVATVSGAYLLAALAVLPLHGTARYLAFIVGALSAAAIARALTPRRARITTAREDRP